MMEIQISNSEEEHREDFTVQNLSHTYLILIMVFQFFEKKNIICHTEYKILLLWCLFISLFRDDGAKFHSHILQNIRHLEAQSLLHYGSPFVLGCLFQLRGSFEAAAFALAVGKVGPAWCSWQVQALGGEGDFWPLFIQLVVQPQQLD